MSTVGIAGTYPALAMLLHILYLCGFLLTMLVYSRQGERQDIITKRPLLSMIRLFIAIDMPPAILTEIEGIGSAIPYARLSPREQMHITLKFIGEVEGSRVLDIKEALHDIKKTQFELCLKGVGVFPPRGTPRVFWAGVHPTEQISALRQTIESTLHGIGIPREKQKFSPHVTLARLNNPPIDRLQQVLAGNALLKTSPFSINSFVLFRSNLAKNGAIHTEIARYALNS